MIANERGGHAPHRPSMPPGFPHRHAGIRRTPLRRRLVYFLLAALLWTGAPAGGLSAAVADCLYMTGTAGLDRTEVVIGETFTLTYTLTPGGTLTETVTRPSADIVLVLDVSGSMNDRMKAGKKQTRLEALKEAAGLFVSSIRDINAGDRIGIVVFHEYGEMLLDLTTNYGKAEQTIRNLRAGGYTNMGNGLETAERMLANSSAERKAVIALSDGANTHYTTTTNFFGHTFTIHVMDSREARNYAKQQASRIAARGIPIHTIALGEAGTGDIDHALLEQISRDSGGQKYDADDAGRLADVFGIIREVITKSGELSGIRIEQPLPGDGFELAGVYPPGTHLSGNKLIIPLPPVMYPYDAPTIDVKVELRQTNHVQEFAFSDALLRYNNACGEPSETVIPGGHLLSVVGWKDTWGNLYVGRGNGEVTRYRLGDMGKPQFTIRERDARVTDISFGDSSPAVDDDVIVRVRYEDGTESVWDLRPSPPTVTVADADGQPAGASGWVKGTATLKLEGSAGQLPAGTIYHNGDFLTAGQGGTYIARYRYQIGGAVREAAEGEVAVLDGTVSGSTVTAAALTWAVSGDPSKPVAGLPATATVKLDNAPPQAELMIVASPSGDPLDPVVRLKAGDAESGVKRITVAADSPSGNVRSLTRTFAPAPGTVTAEWALSEFFADPADRTGWIKFTVEVADEAGWTSALFRTDTDPSVKSAHFELVYPGPKGNLAADADYSVKASAVPVTVRLEDAADVLVAGRTDECASCEPVTVVKAEVKMVTVKPDGQTTVTPWTRLGASSFRVAGEGRHELYVRITDSRGQVYDTKALGKPFVVRIRYDQNRL